MMKRVITFLFLFLAVFSVIHRKAILSYDIIAEIEKNGVPLVREQIRVVAEGNAIKRDLQ